MDLLIQTAYGKTDHLFMVICILQDLDDDDRWDDKMNRVHDVVSDKFDYVMEVRNTEDWSEIKDSLDGSYEEWKNAIRRDLTFVESTVAVNTSDEQESSKSLDEIEEDKGLDEDPILVQSLMENIRKARGELSLLMIA